MRHSPRNRCLPLLLFFCLMMNGCGYQLTNSASGLYHAGQQIWVPFIGNESVSSSAQTVLRRALYDECHALRGLTPSENESAADLKVKGKLLSYGSVALAYNATDQVRVWRLNISVELELYRRGETVPLWKGLLNAEKDYRASDNLALQRNAEESALEGAGRIIAQKFISAAERSY